MVWNVLIGKEIVDFEDVPSDVMEWLIPMIRDARVTEIDPYRDMSLDHSAVLIWLAELRRIEAAVVDETRDTVAPRAHLPREPTARDQVLKAIVDSELAKRREWTTLQRLIRLLDAAAKANATIDAKGD